MYLTAKENGTVIWAYLIIPTRTRRGHFVLQGGSSHSDSNENFLYLEKQNDTVQSSVLNKKETQLTGVNKTLQVFSQYFSIFFYSPSFGKTHKRKSNTSVLSSFSPSFLSNSIPTAKTLIIASSSQNGKSLILCSVFYTCTCFIASILSRIYIYCFHTRE